MAHWIIGPQLIGLIILLTGLVSYYYPPKKINDLYGYRTSSSKKNQQTWDVANRFFAVYSIKAGIILILTGILLRMLIDNMLWPAKTKTLLDAIMLLASGIFTAVITIVATEKHLNKTFKDN